MNLERIKALGCRVKLRQHDQNDPTATPYVLEREPGREYELVRQVSNPDLMFPVNPKTMNVAQVAGFTWFTDRDGELQPLA